MVPVDTISPFKGHKIKKTPDELVQEYGTPAASAKASFTLQRSHYNWKTETFEEAVCPLRDLKPEFSETVDSYLKLLGGKHHEKILDWVSVVTELDKPCAALFLEGASGSGKTLLADGLTRLWSEGEPTELNHVLGGSFNENLTNCPLVLADEQLPGFMKKEGSTAELRSFIQARSRSLTRKFRSSVTLHGAIRLIITGNNRNLFNTGEALTNNDIEALKGRIIYFDVDSKCREYLESLTPAQNENLVKGDEIARHALWLRDNHEIREKDHRFLVKGTNTVLHNAMMTGSGIRGDVCCWLVSYLQKPGSIGNSKDVLVRVSEGALWVHARALVTGWKTYAPTSFVPSMGAISSALSELSSGRKQMKDGAGKLTYYRKIRTELLLSWNDEHGYAIEEEILKGLAKETVL